MRDFDKDGRCVCEMQGQIFEASLTKYNTSSAMFIRRFMNSNLAACMDDPAFLDRPFNPDDSYDLIDSEYGKSSYGKQKYSADELFWIGYIYRYWAYTYEWTSRKVYRAANGPEMRSVYYPYHSLDPAKAIERILEAKQVPYKTDDIERGVKLLREIRLAEDALDPAMIYNRK